MFIKYDVTMNTCSDQWDCSIKWYKEEDVFIVKALCDKAQSCANWLTYA